MAVHKTWHQKLVIHVNLFVVGSLWPICTDIVNGLAIDPQKGVLQNLERLTVKPFTRTTICILRSALI